MTWQKHRLYDKKLCFGWSGVTEDHLSETGLLVPSNLKRRSCWLAILSELLVAAREGRWLCYSRRKSRYGLMPAHVRNGFSYNNTMALIEVLGDEDWIEEERSRPGDLGVQSRIRPSKEMLQRLGDCRYLVHNPVEVLLMKDAEGQLVFYSNTEQTRRWRRDVLRLNEAFRSVAIRLPATVRREEVVWVDESELQHSRNTGYRVFNDSSWRRGGRLYGPFWQNLPKETRGQITIDGYQIEEPDFEHLHPKLLYAMSAKELHGDAYTIKGFEAERPTVKIAWQIIVNARSHRSAVYALARELNGDHEKSRAVLAAVERHHAAISRAFYSNAGTRLQAIDAKLMMDVELAALDKSIVALPIHDSFLVPAGRPADVMREIMDDRMSYTLSRLKH